MFFNYKPDFLGLLVANDFLSLLILSLFLKIYNKVRCEDKGCVSLAFSPPQI